MSAIERRRHVPCWDPQQHEQASDFRLRRKHNIAGAARLSQKCNSTKNNSNFRSCRASWKGVRN